MSFKRIQDYIAATAFVIASIPASSVGANTLAECKEIEKDLSRRLCYDALKMPSTRTAHQSCELEVTGEEVILYAEPNPFGNETDIATPAVYPVQQTELYSRGPTRLWLFEINNGNRVGWVLYNPYEMEASGADCPF